MALLLLSFGISTQHDHAELREWPQGGTATSVELQIGLAVMRGYAQCRCVLQWL